VLVALTAGPFDGTIEDWDALVRAHPGATFFHQYRWLEVVEAVYGGSPHYLAARRDGDLVGVLPVMLRWVLGAGRVLISVPFADEGGMCVDGDEAEHALMAYTKALARDLRASYVELRQLSPLSAAETLCDTSRVVLRMPLPPGAEELWRSLSTKMRNRVRRARRDGLTCQVGGEDQVKAFYQVYARNMRDLGSPMHSMRFFQVLFTTFPGAALTVLIEHRDTVVGAAVAVQFGDTLTLLCASSLATHHTLYPNNLLYWRLFEVAIERGCSLGDFGRSPRETGIHYFKKQWGMEDCQLYRQFVPVLGRPTLGERRGSSAHRAFSLLWRRAPIGLATALGPPIFSRLPI
jgi:FemAB-related protein (PEP-CTERM system-associated)